ncbi:hypothetical protein ACIQC9_09490 [Brevundimonas sp. NPDC092305]|uniref:hypothetical protein n=1 Tax=Brevundimonas sp. NPDC092305 TaxID=3363957 RepID=UPI00380D558C
MLKWRAEHLGPETAAKDRHWTSSRPWTRVLWDENGWLKDVEEMDRLTLEANRETWREEMGIPEGKAEGWPMGW